MKWTYGSFFSSGRISLQHIFRYSTTPDFNMLRQNFVPFHAFCTKSNGRVRRFRTHSYPCVREYYTNLIKFVDFTVSYFSGEWANEVTLSPAQHLDKIWGK